MKTYVLTAITMLNLGVLLVHFIPKTEKGLKENESSNEEFHQHKESLFFQALADENKKSPPEVLLPSKPILIMRFSYRNCDLCLRSALFEMKKWKEAMGGSSVRIMGSFPKNRDFEIFQKTYEQFPFDYEHVPEEYFSLALEKEAQYPFFFLWFPDGSIHHVFLPMKEDVPRTRRFLAVIGSKYVKGNDHELKTEHEKH